MGPLSQRYSRQDIKEVSNDQLSTKKSTEQVEQYSKFEKWQLIKNLVVISVGFNLLFTAFNGLSVLQSTLNQKQGIGIISQAIINAFFALASLLLPTYTIKKLGCKHTLVLGTVLYIPYIAANIYFKWGTMIPTAALLGVAGSLVWSSQCTFVNQAAVLYSKNLVFFGKSASPNKPAVANEQVQREKTIGTENRTLPILEIQLCAANRPSTKQTEIDKDGTSTKATSNSKDSNDGNVEGKIIIPEGYSRTVSSVTARFFGFFGLVCRSSDLCSSLMSYYVLMDGRVLDNVTAEGNCSCGASFCNVESGCFVNNLAEPSQYSRNVLTGVAVALAAAAALLMLLLLDELDRDRKPVSFSFSWALATGKFVRREKALYLLPLSVYVGLLQAFYLGDYTKSYTACAWGLYHVGLVAITYGLSAALFSTISGWLVTYVGRIPVFLGGGLINAALCVFLLLWSPLPEQPYLFFVASGMLGATVGVIWSQLRAFYGVIFYEDAEAAFAAFYMWDTVGYFIGFSYSNYICTYIKVYILLAASTLGLAGYLRTEFIVAHQVLD